MFNSKALKDFDKGCGCPPGKDPKHGTIVAALHKAWHFVKFEVYYKIEGLYHRYVERIGRSIAFARFGWLNYDFDHSTLWDLMQFKLKRIQKCLINGHAVQEEEDMKALQEVIKLTGRLYRGRYEDYPYKLHEHKWGELPMFGSEPCEFDEKGKPTMYRMISKDRPNVKTEEDKVQERKEFMESYEKGEVLRLKDMDRLNELFKKYSNRWWD